MRTAGWAKWVLAVGLVWACAGAARATPHEANGWKIEKKAEETSAEAGGTITYHLRVERTGADAGAINIVDVRDSGATSSYGGVAPAPDGGGGASSAVAWTRTFNQGDVFEATYTVQLNSPLSVGQRIGNYVMADKSPYDPAYHISVDCYVVVGGGNQTKAGNKCTGDSKEPVSTATGEYYLLPQTDLDLGGPLPLAFTRWYAGGMNDPGIDLIGSALGLGWMHNFESRAIHSGFFERSLQVVLPGGKVVFFAEVYGGTGGWQLNFAQEGVAYQGRSDGHSFWMMDPESELLYRFDQPPMAWGSTNRLREIQDRNGNRLELARSAGGLVTNVSDGLGRNLAFTYSASSNLLAVSDGTRTIGFGHDANGVITSLTNAAGHVKRFRYDPVNSFSNGQGALLTEVEYPLGNVPYVQTYNTNGQVVTQTDVYGAVSTFDYGTNGATTVTDPQGAFTHAYANYRRATNLADQAGNAFAYAYDTDRDLPTAVTDRRGFVTSIEYEEASRKPVKIVHRDGGTTTLAYVWTEQVFTNSATGTNFVTFAFRDLAEVTHPGGATEQFQRDGRGNVTGYVDRAGAMWATTCNDRGQPLTIVRPGGGVQTFAYNADGTLASATDSDTGVTTYTYDALRRRTGAAYPDGATEAWAYDHLDRVTRFTDRAGQSMDFAYDDNGNRVGVTDPLGYAVEEQVDLMDRTTNRFDNLGFLSASTYDDMGRVVAVADAAGTNAFNYDARGWLTNRTRGARTESWEYDAEGNVTRAVSPLGHATALAVDAMGRPVAVTNPLGQAFTIAYDAAGRVAAITDPVGGETRYAYDAEGRLTVITNAAGAGASFEYDGDGRRIRATDFDGHATTYGHTPMGRLAAITNALGEATRYSYDTSGRRIRTEHADGARVERTYDVAGRVATETDEGSNTWAYAFDARGAVTAVTNPAGGVATLAYNLDGTVQTAADSDTGTVSNRYDAARRLVEVALPDGANRLYAYNEHDEVTAITDPAGAATQLTYDADGRPVRITDADGHVLDLAYDAAGRLTNVMDRTGARTAYEYDAAGQLTLTIDPTGVRTAVARDALGRATNVTRGTSTWTVAYNHAGVVTQMVTPSGRITTAVPDALQRVARTVDALGRTNVFTYDVRGRLSAATDPAGLATAYAYDPRGWLAGVTLPDGTAVGYELDALGNVAGLTDGGSNAWEFAYSPMGRPLGVTDPLGRATTYTNDLRGQVVGIGFASGESAALERDANGRIVRVQHSAGPDLPFHYDALGRLTNAADVALTYDAEGRVTATVSGGVVFGASYDAAGRLATATYNNGAFAVTYTYATGPDGDGRLTRVADSLTGTQIDFGYDADRRLRTLSLPNGETVTYTWDDADRLVRLQSGDYVDMALSYDLSGRLTESDLIAPLQPRTHLAADTNVWTFDAAAQVSTAGHSYDARGRATATPGLALTWDGASRLTGVNGAALSYNGLGDLRRRADAVQTNRFFHNRAFRLPALVAEQDEPSGAFLRYYVYAPNGRLLYMIDAADGNKVYFHHFDQAGNVLALTDDSGALTDAWAYDPFGRILARTGANPQPFTFSGAWGVRQEGSNGLYQMRARYYDAATARFLSPEPLWPQLANPKALNPYQYVGADPLRFIDPSGREEEHNFFGWEDPTPEDVAKLQLQLSAIQVAQLPGVQGALAQAGLVGLGLEIMGQGLLPNLPGMDPLEFVQQVANEIRWIQRHNAEKVERAAKLAELMRGFGEKKAQEEKECHQEEKNPAVKNPDAPIELYEVQGGNPFGPMAQGPVRQPLGDLTAAGIVEGLFGPNVAAWDQMVAAHLDRSQGSLSKTYVLPPPGNPMANKQEIRQAIRKDRKAWAEARMPQLLADRRRAQQKFNELKAKNQELFNHLNRNSPELPGSQQQQLQQAKQETLAAHQALHDLDRQIDDLVAYEESY